MTTSTPAAILDIPWFPLWFPGQEKVYEGIKNWYDSEKRFLGLAAPTGTGKTLLALLAAKYANARVVIVTDSKGLQRQYSEDTCLLGGSNVVGQNNFRCLLVPSLRVDEGPCHAGTNCAVLKTCPYHEQLDAALGSDIVVTNYAYWLTQRCFGQGLGDVDLVIFDEAHKAFNAVESFLSIHLSRLGVEPLGVFFPSASAKWGEWQQWAKQHLPAVEKFVSEIELTAKDYRDGNQYVPYHISRNLRSARDLKTHFERLAKVEEDWIIQPVLHGYKFTPKWVANHAHYLFGDVPKVMLMSAILSQETCDYLGVDGKDNRDWIDAPSYFPPENTPIWHIPTIRVNRYLDDAGATMWVSRIDNVIRRRLDRKGIVFTVSYDRTRILLHRSQFRDIMHTHGRSDVISVVEAFKSASAPAVLVSPTVTTGWDFADDFCRYIIVGKVPFPDTRDLVLLARSEDDKDWIAYLTMDTLVQECGRASRNFEDTSEVLIVDDVFLGFWYHNKRFAPKWFQDRVKGSLKTVPDVLI